MLAYGQPGKPSFHKFLVVDALASTSQITGAETAVPADSSFHVGTDSLKVAGRMVANAACKEGNGAQMLHARGRLHGDTLVVTLFRTGRGYVYELDVKVWGDEFSTLYRISARNGLSTVNVLPTDQVLVLKQPKLARGQVVEGFVNFRGTRWEAKSPARPWEARMDWVESECVVRGPFRVTIE